MRALLSTSTTLSVVLDPMAMRAYYLPLYYSVVLDPMAIEPTIYLSTTLPRSSWVTVARRLESVVVIARLLSESVVVWLSSVFTSARELYPLHPSIVSVSSPDLSPQRP
jgi:hypothetical protein